VLQDVAKASSAAAAAPDSSQALLDLGEALYRNGDTLAATDNIAEAYVLAPFNTQARYDALILYFSGTPFRTESAAAMDLADNVYTEARSPDARQKLGALLLQQHHISQAVSQLGLAVEFSDATSADSLMLLGVALQQLGGHDNIEQSIDYLTQALHLRPGSSEIADALRNSLRIRGDSEADIEAHIESAQTGQ
jgi:Flp pilus assembly protein TadD